MKKNNHIHILMSEWLIIVSFTCICITTFLQVIFRYILNFSISWTDELSRYSFVWLVCSGIVISFVRGEHATVNLLMSRYKGRYRVLMFTLIDIFIYILFTVLIINGIRFMNLSVGQSTPSLGIPKMLVYAALPFGSATMLIELTLRLYKRFTGRLEE